MSYELKSDRRHTVNRITNEIDSLYHAVALKLGLSDSAMFILYTVYDNGGACPLSEICGNGVISKQTVNSAIRKLESDGILRLEQYKGKAKIAVLTDKGKAFGEGTVARLLNAEDQAFSSWSTEEIESYIALNQKFYDSLKARIDNL